MRIVRGCFQINGFHIAVYEKQDFIWACAWLHIVQSASCNVREATCTHGMTSFQPIQVDTKVENRADE